MMYDRSECWALKDWLKIIKTVCGVDEVIGQ